MIFSLFSPDIFLPLSKWLILFILCALLFRGLWKDYQRVEAYIVQHPEGDKNIQVLFHSLTTRNIQLSTLILLLIILICAGDIKSSLPTLPRVQNTPIATFTPAKITPLPTPSSSTTLVPAATPSLLPFTEITEFNEKDGRQEATLDLLKQRYEAWLVTYFYLKNCNKTEEKDLSVILQSLDRDLIAAHAEHNIVDNITLAADGSYKEIYSYVPCDKDRLAATTTAYEKVMQPLRNKP